MNDIRVCIFINQIQITKVVGNNLPFQNAFDYWQWLAVCKHNECNRKWKYLVSRQQSLSLLFVSVERIILGYGREFNLYMCMKLFRYQLFIMRATLTQVQCFLQCVKMKCVFDSDFYLTVVCFRFTDVLKSRLHLDGYISRCR